MALQAAYKQFLAAPNPDQLASDASLHYVTTLVSYNGSAEVMKHLRLQDNLLKKKEEKCLDAVEAPNAIAVEVQTTIEFLIGGGAYLPGLDDNFLADRTVTFPIIHIVSFNGNGKVQQVRQNWDQGSLLKLIDVIGKTGRNWPIRDGQDQIKLIANSVKHGGNHTTADGKDASEEEIGRARATSNNVTRDPHASLSLFAPREQTIQESMPQVVAPRASAKPPPRDYHELFTGNESDQSPAAESFKKKDTSRERSESPSKHAKAGAGKNYKPIRLFENDENSPPHKETQQKMYRPNEKKYEHFDFAGGPAGPSELPKAMDPKTKTKHGSQWNFDDFSTPEKAVPTKTMGGRNTRHWGNDHDEVMDSPVYREKVDKPRKDAETHFEFIDDGTPEDAKRIIGHPRGPGGLESGTGLYRNNVYDEEGAQSGATSANDGNALKPVTNIKDRRKDFDPHFEMRDYSPVSKNFAGDAASKNNKNNNNNNNNVTEKENIDTLSANGTKTSMPIHEKNAKPLPKERGIAIGGDGMGGRAGAGRSWGFGDDGDGMDAGAFNSTGRKGVPGKKQGTSAQTDGGGDFWDF